ncbi:21 kDa protein-like [Syzygium oleosum]|uniref:21 kDa protein-like n=1 Tax=Syzygium oleosum TaxID=219896 RepID=UPI0011D22B82|nr:21 kDa protein-like [Syzygium oleosum]
MARPGLLFLLLASTFVAYFISSTAAATPSSSSAAGTNFIKASCSATSYPALCVESLSAYADTVKLSHKELAQAALAVSLARAQATRDFVTRSARLKGLKAREYEAVKDCLEEMGDTVDRLSKSMTELKGMGSKSKGQDFVWHVSNVETWVSAALTDESTCMDGFSGKATEGRLKTSFRTRLVNVAQVTSNALALVNRFASKH